MKPGPGRKTPIANSERDRELPRSTVVIEHAVSENIRPDERNEVLLCQTCTRDGPKDALIRNASEVLRLDQILEMIRDAVWSANPNAAD